MSNKNIKYVTPKVNYGHNATLTHHIVVIHEFINNKYCQFVNLRDINWKGNKGFIDDGAAALVVPAVPPVQRKPFD